MSSLRRFGFVSASLLLVAPITASADDAVRLDALQALALENHPAGSEMEALRRLGRAELSIARTWPDPTFEGLVGRGDPSGPEPSRRETGFEVTQEVPSPIGYRHRIQAAEFGVVEREAQGRARRLDLLYAVEVLFYDYAASREVARVLEQNAQGAQRVLELISRRAELGEARETERIRAEIELLRIRRALAAASREVDTAGDALRRTVGPGLPERFETEALWPSVASVGSRSDLEARMAVRNPELIGARAHKGAAEEGARAAAWQAWPDLAATYYDVREIDKTARGARLGVRIPLWNANRPETARLRAETSIARAELRRLEIELGNALDRAYREYRVAAEQSDLFATRLLPAAAESARLVELAYKEGETSILDVLDAQRTYREAGAELIEIRREAARALATIHRLTGGTGDIDKS